MIEGCKVWTDLSHYIAILPKKNPNAFPKGDDPIYYELNDGSYVLACDHDTESDVIRKTTKAEEFNRLYNETIGLSFQCRFQLIVNFFIRFFGNDEAARVLAKHYVSWKFDAKKRAQRARSLRFKRKAALNHFSFFCTFTYDDSKCSSYAEFDRQLRVFFMNRANRYGWRVMFVPEFGKATGRFHIHALISVPDGSSIPGEFSRVRSYNKKKHRMITSISNSYFSMRWGRNDWQSISEMTADERRSTIGYVIKYLTKTDGRAFYSRGIATFLYADVNDDDIVSFIFRGEHSVVLFDDWRPHLLGKDLGPVADWHVKKLAFYG